MDIKLRREGFRIFVCWVLHYFAESHNWCSILEVEQITRGRIFMAVTWWPVTTRTPGPGLRCHGGHYPLSPDHGQPGNIRLWFCHKSKVHICGTFRSWLEVYCIHRCSKQLTVPYSLDKELWFIHPHQFWTWKISDDTRLLFNCTGSGDKKSGWLIIIRLTTENWKWLFVSLA